jgi:hypothetical protein
MAVSLEYLATIYTTANYQILPAWREKYFNPTTASRAGRRDLSWIQEITGLRR